MSTLSTPAVQLTKVSVWKFCPTMDRMSVPEPPSKVAGEL
jgi:hypothetical protein